MEKVDIKFAKNNFNENEIVDFSNYSGITSGAIRIMIVNNIKITNVSKKIRDILEITGFIKIIY